MIFNSVLNFTQSDDFLDWLLYIVHRPQGVL